MDVGTTNETARIAWIKHVLSEIPTGARILDAGAGELKYKPFCAHLKYVSQDFGRYDGQGDGSGLQTGSWEQSQIDIMCDIASIPEPSESFDAVMCIEVLEHVPDPVNVLRELTRLVKPGGVLITTVPFCSLTHFSPYFYQTGHSRYFFEYWLGKFGFDIEEIEWNGNYFEYLGQELRRLPWVGDRYAGINPKWFEKTAIQVLLRLLDRLSKNNNGSEQLLAYGLHIRARRK